LNHLRLYMIVFGVLVSLPLAFVAWRTYGALDREAQAQVRFFSERLLDEIEAELADLVRREEDRAVDEYRHTLVQDGGTIPSPLARTPAESFILGYFQNNPDGSFQTPMVRMGTPCPTVLPIGSGSFGRSTRFSTSASSSPGCRRRPRFRSRPSSPKKSSPPLPTGI
jgi:hypothetical protein